MILDIETLSKTDSFSNIESLNLQQKNNNSYAKNDFVLKHDNNFLS